MPRSDQPKSGVTIRVPHISTLRRGISLKRIKWVPQPSRSLTARRLELTNPRINVFLMSRSTLTLALLTLSLFLSACKPVGPNYQRPQYTPPSAYKETGASTVAVPPPTGTWTAANPSDGMLRGKWWEIYNDPQLNQYEDRIAGQNQSLHSALETYYAARENVRIARAAFSPTFSAGPGFSHDKLSQHRPLAIGSAPENNYNDLTLEGQASWEPDFWGLIRRNVESNQAAAQASAADLANVDLSLHAELAEDYFNLRGLDTQAQLLQSDIRDLTNQLDLTKRRQAGGIGTGVDVAQAQTQLDTTKAQLVDIGIARQEYEHAIGTIAYYHLNEFSIPPSPLSSVEAINGGTTDQNSTTTPSTTGPTSAGLINAEPPTIPLGLPSQLLERRPDIASAERHAQQANALIGVAVAAFYPSIQLSGGGGFESTHIGNFIQGPSALWSLGAQATQLLIDGGRRRAVTDQARDNFEAQAANYKNTVVLAFQEVEDKLSDLRQLEQEEAAEKAAVSDAQRSFNISTTRYKGGVTTYLEVITAETTLIQNQRTEANLKSQRFEKSVELIRALGGSWDTTQLPK